MLKKSVRANLERLGSDLTAYRLAMDRIFSASPSEPCDCREYFFELLACVSRLYLDYLLLARELLTVGARRKAATDRQSKKVPLDKDHFRLLRSRFRERLESLPCWAHFEPEIPFSELTGLRTFTDYINSFALHLPEIYEEAIRAEQYAKGLLRDSEASGTVLAVSLEHLGRNHISFVLQALQWAADESTWRDP